MVRGKTKKRFTKDERGKAGGLINRGVRGSGGGRRGGGGRGVRFFWGEGGGQRGGGLVDVVKEKGNWSGGEGMKREC